MEVIEYRVIKYFSKFGIKSMDKNSIINPDNFLSDDANLMMKGFIDEFQINQGYLQIDRYFNPLPALCLKYFWNLITFNVPKLQPKPPVTIAHMIEVAKRKEWFDPE
jgi:hypothetical protein